MKRLSDAINRVVTFAVNRSLTVSLFFLFPPLLFSFSFLVIKQRRISFLYAQQSFIVHQYVKPSSVEGLCILHAQVEASSSSTGQEFKEPEVKLPPFLSVDRMLLNTKEDEKQYGAYSVSLKQPPSE